jgi:hypothetical protein
MPVRTCGPSDLCSLLYLLTAGKFHLFSPPRWLDYSWLVLYVNWVLSPITETGFDQFALDRFASRYIVSDNNDFKIYNCGLCHLEVAQ